MVLLLMQGVSADCYYTYPALKVQEANGCPCGPYDYGCDCTDEEITYCSQTPVEDYDPDGQNYFKISNCQCRDEPVDMFGYESCYEFDYLPKYDRLDYYDFEETCSFDVSFVSSSEWHDMFGGSVADYAEFNNIPLYPSKCSPCVGNKFTRTTANYRDSRDPCEGLSESKCRDTYYVSYLDYNSFPAPYFYPFWQMDDIVEDIQALAFRDVLLNLGETKIQDYLNDAYGYQCIWKPDEGCKPYILEQESITKENGEKFVREYYTYQPCNPPMTCDEICEEKFGRDGECLGGADESHPGALKQGPKYCGQEATSSINGQAALEGAAQEECICEDHKPVVKDVILYVHPEYLEKRGFGGVITGGWDLTYFQHKLEVLGLNNRAEWPYSSSKILYETDGRVRDYDELICEATVTKENANEKELMGAYAYLWVSDGKTEKKVPISRSSEGIPYPFLGLFPQSLISCSDLGTGVFNCKIKFRPIDVLGKDARGKKISCEIIPFDRVQKGDGKKSNELIVVKYVLYAAPIDQDSYGSVDEQYKMFTQVSEIDDSIGLSGKLVLLDRVPLDYFGSEELKLKFKKAVKSRLNYRKENEFDYKKDKMIGITKLIWQRGLADYSLVEVFIEVNLDVNNKNNLLVLAHELGHAYAGYCDEYDREKWLIEHKKLKCLNSFPKCCLAKSSIEYACTFRESGYTEKCRGMPYAEDKKTRTDEKLPVGPYWSIMGMRKMSSKDALEGVSLPDSLDDFIYPLPSKCPLRGC
jgi:hypothetical protein